MSRAKYRIEGEFYTRAALRLHEARTAKGYSMGQLSIKTGLSVSAICGYEAGRRLPSVDRLRDLCRALNVSADWVLGLKETKEVNS